MPPILTTSRGSRNLSNLLGARAAARSAEYSVRLALGASWERLVAQAVAEVVPLLAAGGALGVPGVASAGMVNRLPLAGNQTMSINVETAAASIVDMDAVDSRPMTPDYFATLRIPLRAGRTFTAQSRSSWAAVGIDRVVTYGVAQRRREFGIRVALGATSGRVSLLVVREGASMAVIGSLVGLVVAFALRGMMRNVVFGIKARDAISFGSATLTLLGVALLASYIPARRASAIDPAITLRAE